MLEEEERLKVVISRIIRLSETVVWSTDAYGHELKAPFRDFDWVLWG